MTGKTKAPDDFRMNAGEFDRMMGKALRVKPSGVKKPKAKAKARKKAGEGGYGWLTADPLPIDAVL